jgi:prolyl 4-hydroxylase
VGVPIQLIDLELPFAWELGEVFDPATCDRLLAAAHAAGWLEGTVQAREGRVVRPEIRDADVAVLRDPELVARVQERAWPHLPPEVKGAPLVGLRNPLRVYHYQPGQFFGLHRDQKYREPGAISHLALLVYLCDTDAGGVTAFPEADLRVAPRRGHGVLFQNATLHAGEAVQRGTKALLRADVMYASGISPP